MLYWGKENLKDALSRFTKRDTRKYTSGWTWTGTNGSSDCLNVRRAEISRSSYMQKIFEETHGNPLFIQELLKCILGRTLLFRNGKWIISS